MDTPTDFFDPIARTSRARLAVAVELMRELSRYSDPNELSVVFARRMNQLYPTSRQITLTQRGVKAPQYRVSRYNLWPETIDPYREPHRLPVLCGGLFGEFMQDEQPRLLEALTLAADDPATEYLHGEQSVLAIPIFEAGKPISVVVLTRTEPAAFPREQIPELVWLTNLFGRATQSLVLSGQLQAAYDTAQYELREIEAFQQNLLPTDVPNLPGLDVGVHYQTAHRAGGDYYDFFPLPHGKLGVLLADVSGHGAPAAMLMAVTHSLAHGYSEPPLHPGEFLAYLNRAIAKRYTTGTGNFVTALYGVFDPQAGTFAFANAGHAAPRARLGRADRFQSLDQVRRLPLGVTHRHVGPYPEQLVALQPGDCVALFTDGITEAVNATQEHFGLGRLDAALNRSTSCADCVVSDVIGDLEHFIGQAGPADDRTLLLVGLTEPSDPNPRHHVTEAQVPGGHVP